MDLRMPGARMKQLGGSNVKSMCPCHDVSSHCAGRRPASSSPSRRFKKIRDAMMRSRVEHFRLVRRSPSKDRMRPDPKRESAESTNKACPFDDLEDNIISKMRNVCFFSMCGYRKGNPAEIQQGQSGLPRS